ncbi:mannose-binding protein [Streptomyces sp. NPDC058620]|uniref:mannose-binding protein n=1 Tax=Streptomyces sp. NPDC058620 TaxID=3346560 RepID=UPI003661C0F6
MPPEHTTPGANAAAAAAPDVEEAGPSPAPSAPAEETPEPATAAPEAKPGATPDGETATTPSPPATATADAPEEGTGVAAAAVGTAPRAKTGTGADAGRPRKPILAGAAVVGAALIAIPLLLVGSANDKGHDDTARRPAAEGADTVLNPDSAPAAMDHYVAGKPSASPSKEKPKKSEAPKATVPKVTVPKPVAPAPEPRTSSPATRKPAPASKPKPKPAPQPSWSTVTVFSPSTLEVNQAWTTNRIRMVMQTDGNLVVMNEQGKPIWASMTFGANHRAIFQPDGNLVIHNGADRAIWASRTHDHGGAQLVLRADAKVVIVSNGTVVWST